MFAGGAPRYLQITLGESALSPRLRIGTVPHAGVAADLACTGCVARAELDFEPYPGIGAGEVTTAKIADGAVTGAKIQSVPAGKITGTLADAQIAGLSASKITGTIADAQIEALSASKLTGSVTSDQIASLAAGKISGLIEDAQIESLDAAKIDGLVEDGQIESLAAAKITGAFDLAQIPSIPNSKLLGPSTVTAVTSAPEQPAEGTLYWDKTLKALRLWDGAAWIDVASFGCGKSAATAKPSCKAIRDQCPGAASGTYYVTAGGSAPIAVYCEMIADGGGWTLFEVGKNLGTNLRTNNAVGTLSAPAQSSSAKLARSEMAAILKAGEKRFKWGAPAYGYLYTGTLQDTWIDNGYCASGPGTCVNANFISASLGGTTYGGSRFGWPLNGMPGACLNLDGSTGECNAGLHIGTWGSPKADGCYAWVSGYGNSGDNNGYEVWGR